MSSKTGVILVNLGSPSKLGFFSLASFYSKFLMDPNVIDVPFFFRALLVFFIVIPFRTFKSIKLYKKIWHPIKGSPLIWRSLEFFEKLKSTLSHRSDLFLEIAMRYGKPTLRRSLEKLKNEKIENLILFPLYPQGTSSSSGTIIEKIKKINIEIGFNPKLKIIAPFYSEPGYVTALGENIRKKLDEKKFDALLFSYHGIPVRHIQKEVNDCSDCLLKSGCCDKISDLNSDCYRAQCFETSRKVATYLELESDFFGTCFQSTFGKAKWIEPELIFTLDSLKARGKKKILVVCPSFVVDCLENLEEVAISAKKHFESSGEFELDVTSCLNSDELWVDFVASKCKEF